MTRATTSVQTDHSGQAPRAGGSLRTAHRRLVAALLAGLTLWLAAGTARADEYDPKKAGHPLRIVAYVVHPIGVTLDYLILRPAWWIGSYEPFRTLFGRED